MINSGVETPISSMEGITPSRKFSTPLDLAQAFGQPVDVAEVAQNRKIVEARKNQEASKAAIVNLVQEVYRPIALHSSFTGMADNDAHALWLRTVNFFKILQSLMNDYDVKSELLLELNPDETWELLDSNTISQKIWTQTKQQADAVLSRTGYMSNEFPVDPIPEGKGPKPHANEVPEPHVPSRAQEAYQVPGAPQNASRAIFNVQAPPFPILAVAADWPNWAAKAQH